MSIIFNNTVFSEPVQISSWSPPYRAGIYAILVPDSTASPKPFRVIYFGESGNMSERGFVEGHHKYTCFLNQAGSELNIYIATYLMPNSTPLERKKLENLLIYNYHPICNKD